MTAPTDKSLADFVASVEVSLDPCALFRRVVGEPDPFQAELLRSTAPFIVLLASRQVGKSESIGCLAARELTRPGALVLVISPSERQSKELLRRATAFKDALGLRAARSTQNELETEAGARLISLPASSETIRGYSGASLIVFDEAAFLPGKGEIIPVVLPMRAALGRVVMASTPNGMANYFAETWHDSKFAHRIHARSIDIPRLASKVQFDRDHMPDLRFRVEHLCDFRVSGGTPFFNLAAVQAAFVEGEPLWA